MPLDATEADAALERRKKKVDIISSWFGMAAVLFGGLYGLYEYLQKKSDDRVKEAIAFLDRYQKDPVAASRIKVQSAWRRHDEERRCVVAQDSSGFPKYTAFVLDTIASEKIEQDVENLIDFFGTLQVCVSKSICDEETAKAYFGDAARYFYRTHFVWIDTTRKRWNDPGYASGLENFKNSLPKKSAPAAKGIEAIKNECAAQRG